MAATLELKYFNSFWVKKMDSIMDTRDTTAVVATTDSSSTTIDIKVANAKIGVGQRVKNNTIQQTIPDYTYVTAVDMSATPHPQVTVNNQVNVTLNETLEFGPIGDFTDVPRVYSSTPASDWYAEEARIRGGYNNTNVDLGVKAYLVEDDPTQNHRSNSIIYSGIFNSRTGVNETNQFSVAESITRAVDPKSGSIQKLYSEDTNLIIFQEGKVNRALIDKDAIYTAEGGQLTASGQAVVGQIVPYAGEYGISTNPESFAVYGYRKYFADRTRSAILRLSQDGITEISNYGMFDYFRDELALVGNTGLIIGGWDMHTKQYVVGLQPPPCLNCKSGEVVRTLAFDEAVLGWTSRFSYEPDLMGSLRNNFYTNKDGDLWKHYANSTWGSFYGTTYPSTVTVIFNNQPSLSKTFKTINYEGSPGWSVISLIGNEYEKTNIEGQSVSPSYPGDTAFNISPYIQYTNLADLENSLFTNNFKRKEDKYFANILNVSAARPGEVAFGQDIMGIKGFFATATFSVDNADANINKAELFAASTNYVESSY
jgi:hypothetical protein